MTTVVSNTITSFAINNTTPFFLTTTGVVNSNGTAITFGGTSDPGSAIIAGNVSGQRGIQTNGNDHIDIAQTGTVVGTDSGDPLGIFLSGVGNSVRIAGTVTSDGIGIYLTSADNEIVITETGVVRGGASNHPNGGGNSYSVAISMFNSGSTTTLINNGDIIAEVNADTGFRIAVANSGAGSDFNGLAADFDSSARFFNTGFVLGDVYLAAGEDLYDARGGGIVNGRIDLGAGDDIFRGGENDEEATGGLDNDVMRGGGGSDTLYGQDGNDTLSGDDGSDVLSGNIGNDNIIGGDGSDTLSGGKNADTVRGGDGQDEINGGSGSDFLVGGASNDEMDGGRGSDDMRGSTGDDALFGGGGSDTLTGGSGDDVLRGEAGGDTFVFNGHFGQDKIVGFADRNNEKIDLSGLNRIVSFNDLVNNHLDQVGPDAVIDAGHGDVITIAGFNANALDAGDFLF